MSEYKVYKMDNNLEWYYITKGAEVHLFMAPARNKAIKDSIFERIVLLIIKMFFAYSVSYFVSIWAIQEAYNERGYKAYGGEYILIMAAFGLAYGLISNFFKYFRREKKWEKEV